MPGGVCVTREGTVISTGVGLQAALNGDRTKAAHAATPVSVEELTQDAAACVAAGACAIHLHPPDPECRLELVWAWRAPDYASVNLSETGATEVMEALAEAGIGIEAGVWTAEDAERLGASGRGGLGTRVLVEARELPPRDSEGKAAHAPGL